MESRVSSFIHAFTLPLVRESGDQARRGDVILNLTLAPRRSAHPPRRHRHLHNCEDYDRSVRKQAGSRIDSPVKAGRKRCVDTYVRKDGRVTVVDTDACNDGKVNPCKHECAKPARRGRDAAVSEAR